VLVNREYFDISTIVEMSKWAERHTVVHVALRVSETLVSIRLRLSASGRKKHRARLYFQTPGS
jgi:hypothetical protein